MGSLRWPNRVITYQGMYQVGSSARKDDLFEQKRGRAVILLSTLSRFAGEGIV